MLWRLTLLTVGVCMASFILLQVIWPAVRNRPLFPMFRYWRAQRDLAKAQEVRVKADIKRQTLRIETEANRVTEEAFDELLEDAEKRHHNKEMEM